jgi:hypothetical protein
MFSVLNSSCKKNHNQKLEGDSGFSEIDPLLLPIKACIVITCSESSRNAKERSKVYSTRKKI